MSALNVQGYHALSSGTRLEILRLLYRKPRGILELAENLNLQSLSVRFHLLILQEAGIVEPYTERTRSVGKPKVFYKIVKSMPTVMFPARQFLELSRAIMNKVVDTLGSEDVAKLMADVGVELGRKAVEYIGFLNGEHWTPKKFVEIYVNKYLDQLGLEPEVVEVTENRVVYRIHNCVFYELSREKPTLMCDVVNRQIWDTVIGADNNAIADTQTGCMASGDCCCEHVVTWHSEEKAVGNRLCLLQQQ